MMKRTILFAALLALLVALPLVSSNPAHLNLAILVLMAAQLMGIDSHRMFALAWGIGAACAGAAGVLLATFFPIFPEVGANFILLAFVVVNLGGFGSVTGAFWAGILVGVIEVMGGLLLGPQFKLAVVLVLFLAVLMFRPQGLMGKS